MLESNGAMEYRKLPCGFGEFSDCTVISDSMRRIYAAASFPIFGSSLTSRAENPLEKKFSPLLRASFQNRVFPDPFCASDDCRYKDRSKIVFIDCLFSLTIGFPLTWKVLFFQLLNKHFGIEDLTCKRPFLIHMAQTTTILKVGFKWMGKLITM